VDNRFAAEFDAAELRSARHHGVIDGTQVTPWEPVCVAVLAQQPCAEMRAKKCRAAGHENSLPHHLFSRVIAKAGRPAGTLHDAGIVGVSLAGSFGNMGVARGAGREVAARCVTTKGGNPEGPPAYTIDLTAPGTTSINLLASTTGADGRMI
jgi:hypothetical protein